MEQVRILVKTVMNIRVKWQHVGKFVTGCATGSFPRRTQIYVVRRLEAVQLTN
jgi:hypothetical protein